MPLDSTEQLKAILGRARSSTLWPLWLVCRLVIMKRVGVSNAG